MFSNTSQPLMPGSYEAMMFQNRNAGLFFGAGGLTTGNHGMGQLQAAPVLYAGKWTLEEEKYVTFLCEEFRAGALDLPEGKSLRCFLADQLGCNAKRISKKYERTGYNGKLQYVDKRSAMSKQELAKHQERLQDLDRKFRESRETLKIVEASRKRTAFSAHSSTIGRTTSNALLANAQKKQKTHNALLAAASAHPNFGLTALGGLGADPRMGQSLHVLGAPSMTNTAMDSLFLRRSLLAQHQALQQSNNDLIRSSMFSALQKYEGNPATTVTAGGTPAPALLQDPPTTSTADPNKNTGLLPTLSSVAALLDTPPTFDAAQVSISSSASSTSSSFAQELLALQQQKQQKRASLSFSLTGGN